MTCDCPKCRQARDEDAAVLAVLVALARRSG
jgi:hypothetical protein